MRSAASATGSRRNVVRNVKTGGVRFSFRVGRYHYHVLTGVWAGIVWSLAPTVLVGLIFWLIMRLILRADRTERDVYARMEAEERARRGMTPKA